jgi:hypothetical protein
MELTKEHFDEVIKGLATKEDVERSKEEIVLRFEDGLAVIDDDL